MDIILGVLIGIVVAAFAAALYVIWEFKDWDPWG